MTNIDNRKLYCKICDKRLKYLMDIGYHFRTEHFNTEVSLKYE